MVNLVCREGQSVTIEVVPSIDDGYQLILRSSDLPLVLAVRLALLNRLEVSSPTGYLFHVIYYILHCFFGIIVFYFSFISFIYSFLV